MCVVVFFSLALLRSLTYCLSLFRPGQPLAIKLRAQSIVQAVDMKRAMPRMKQVYFLPLSIASSFSTPSTKFFSVFALKVYLYRNGIDTVDSYGMAFFNNGFLHLLRSLRLDGWFIYSVFGMRSILPVVAPLYGTS